MNPLEEPFVIELLNGFVSDLGGVGIYLHHQIEETETAQHDSSLTHVEGQIYILLIGLGGQKHVRVGSILSYSERFEGPLLSSKFFPKLLNFFSFKFV